MRYSQLFGKTLKIAPKDADTASHRLLVQGGFIDQLAAGLYTFLPLGWRVHQKIANIIREEMDAIGGQELGMSVLQPKSLWAESGRWDKMDPPLFRVEDRHGKELALGSTHEEVITDLVRTRVNSYKDLPLALYQIQTKFRNEMRATGGLLRVREFAMKDLYSFHADKKDLSRYFKRVVEAYKKIFTRCGVDAIVSQASGGTIGGTETYEFQVISDVGEDEIIYCPGGDFAANFEVSPVKEGKQCDLGHGPLKRAKTIEVGHVFSLGTQYSEKMGAYFVDKNGKKKPIEMGCYGIGVGRLMGTIVEVHHDDKGILWPRKSSTLRLRPEGVSPYEAMLVHIEDPGTEPQAKEVYEKLTKVGIEVLWDDREDVSAGEKFADADLIGIPVRLVVSAKTKDKVEWKDRDSRETELLTVDQILNRFKKS